MLRIRFRPVIRYFSYRKQYVTESHLASIIRRFYPDKQYCTNHARVNATLKHEYHTLFMNVIDERFWKPKTMRRLLSGHERRYNNILQEAKEKQVLGRGDAELLHTVTQRIPGNIEELGRLPLVSVGRF